MLKVAASADRKQDRAKLALLSLALISLYGKVSFRVINRQIKA